MNTPIIPQTFPKNLSLVRAIAVLAFLLCGTAALCGAEYTDIIEKTFPITEGGQLKTVLVDANITVSSHDKQEVYVHITRKVKGKSEEDAQEIFTKHLIEFESKSDALTITTRREDKKSKLWSFRSGSFNMDIEMLVPRKLNTQLKTVDGDVSLAGVDGKVDIHSVDGDLEVRDVSGELNLKTVDGDTRISNLLGPLTVRTVDGDLVLREIHGSIQGKTIDGDVEIEMVGQPNEDSQIESVDGDIELTLGDHVEVTIDAHASDGGIDMPFVAESIQKRGDSTHIVASVNGGGPKIRLQTRDGDITAN